MWNKSDFMDGFGQVKSQSQLNYLLLNYSKKKVVIDKHNIDVYGQLYHYKMEIIL